MVEKVQRSVEVPQVEYEDKVVEVPVAKQVNVPMVQTVQREVQVPQVQYVDKVVEVPVQKQVGTTGKALRDSESAGERAHDHPGGEDCRDPTSGEPRRCKNGEAHRSFMAFDDLFHGFPSFFWTFSLRYVDKHVHIPVQKHRQVPVQVPVEKPMEVNVIETTEKVIDVPVVKQIAVPQVQTIERIVEIPFVQVVEKVVEVPQVGSTTQGSVREEHLELPEAKREEHPAQVLQQVVAGPAHPVEYVTEEPPAPQEPIQTTA